MQVISRSGAKKVINVKFKKNDMYMREIKYFLNCIKKNISPNPNIQHTKYVFKKFLNLS